MNITELVKNKTARFVRYPEGHFVYEIDDGFQFPVPLAEVGNATLTTEDKALFFMHWIRRHLKTLANGDQVGISDDLRNPIRGPLFANSERFKDAKTR